MIVPEIMRVGFKYIAKTNSGYTAIRILRLIPSPLVIRQGGHSSNLGGSFTKKFPIAFSEILYVDFMCIADGVPDGRSSGHWVKSYGKSSFSGACNFSVGTSFLWTALGI